MADNGNYKQAIGAAWSKTTKKGDQFFSISIGDKRYVAWKNTFKKHPTEPDFKIYEDNYEKPKEIQQASKPVPAVVIPKESIVDTEDELPF